MTGLPTGGASITFALRVCCPQTVRWLQPCWSSRPVTHTIDTAQKRRSMSVLLHGTRGRVSKAARQPRAHRSLVECGNAGKASPATGFGLQATGFSRRTLPKPVV